MKLERHSKIVELIGKYEIDTQEELAGKAHNYELREEEDVILCVDAVMSGPGSNSCGPALAKEFRADFDRLTWQIGIS